MTSSEEFSTQGLPGLKSIRCALDMKANKLAKLAESTPKWISEIEIGRSDCTQKLQRRLAAILCCTVADLVGVPTESRIKEIRRSYHLTQADADESGAA